MLACLEMEYTDVTDEDSSNNSKSDNQSFGVSEWAMIDRKKEMTGQGWMPD